MFILSLILLSQGVAALLLSRWIASTLGEKWRWSSTSALFGWGSLLTGALTSLEFAAGAEMRRAFETLWAEKTFMPFVLALWSRAAIRHFWPDAAPAPAGDVRTDAEMVSALAEPFDPQPFIDDAIGSASVFMGLDTERRPIYLSRSVIDKNHIEILGESGTGKSSIAGVLLSQLAAAGECVVIFDPKADKRLPGALALAGERYGYPFHILDLSPKADYPQLNPFTGCRRDQVEELLQVALELGKSGDGAVDYHRGNDREATEFLSAALADGKTDMLEILQKAGQDERIVEQVNLWRELKQLARVKALHTEGGLDLNDVLSKPGVLYVVGSTMRLEVVAAQKLILQRILQVLDERENQDMPVAIFLDELKYLLSPAALRAAGTIRDRNCHLIFAHQSLGDLDDCGGLNPKAVRGAIWGNTGIKIVYRIMDANTASELSKIAGHEVFQGQSVMENDNGVSVTTRNEKREYMPPHVFTHLPKPSQSGAASVGIVFGLGPAWYCATRYVESGPMPKPVRAEHRDGEAQQPDVDVDESVVVDAQPDAQVTDSGNTVSEANVKMTSSKYSDEV